MMLAHSLVRARLGGLITTAVGDRAHVYPRTPTGLPVLPAVVIGQPSWRGDTGPCFDSASWPIAVLVAQAGTDDEATQAQLEELWPDVVSHLKNATETDQTLDGVCVDSQVERADFGSFSIAGTRFPAQILTIQLHG